MVGRCGSGRSVGVAGGNRLLGGVAGGSRWSGGVAGGVAGSGSSRWCRCHGVSQDLFFIFYPSFCTGGIRRHYYLDSDAVFYTDSDGV